MTKGNGSDEQPLIQTPRLILPAGVQPLGEPQGNPMLDGGDGRVRMSVERCVAAVEFHPPVGLENIAPMGVFWVLNGEAIMSGMVRPPVRLIQNPIDSDEFKEKYGKAQPEEENPDQSANPPPPTDVDKNG